jgi:hypothetical protein
VPRILFVDKKAMITFKESGHMAFGITSINSLIHYPIDASIINAIIEIMNTIIKIN